VIHFWSIYLLRPWWLAVVPFVAVIAYLSARATSAIGDWTRVIDQRLLAALAARGAVIPGHARGRFASALVACLIACALTGPALQRADSSTYRNLDATVIAIDLSRSVAVGGHLAEARTAARAVAEAAGSRQVALVVYAGDAYLASAFTTDREALGTTIDALDGQTIPDPGTRAARGLGVARSVLTDARIAQGDVVLISDGGGIDSSVFAEAKALALAGHSLETLFIPAKTVMPDGAPKPDRASLDALAASIQGLSADVLDMGPVLTKVANSPVQLGQGDYAVLAWSDLGRFLIAAALIPALFLFRRKA
jgi:Ca-activated chloride channel family protein